VIKTDRIRRARHAARMGEIRCIQNCSQKSLEGRNHLVELDVDGRIHTPNIKTDSKEIVYEGVGRIKLAHVGSSGGFLYLWYI
jgi:hypothetical protein